jgi:amino acid adenylation domain-containing protein
MGRKAADPVTLAMDYPVDFPDDLCIHELFQSRAERDPDAVALSLGEEAWTYRDLNREANGYARFLLRRGIRPDAPVGVFMARSREMIVSVLGILKAGGAYVPLDPAYPKARLDGMLREVRFDCVLTLSRLRPGLPETDVPVHCMDLERASFPEVDEGNPPRSAGPHNLAYVIFTSGSTGKSKAAAVTHSGWRNLMNWFTREFEITYRDKVLLVSSFSFDITQRALAMPLICGGELHLLASEYYHPELVLETIARRGITLMNCAPSPFYPLVEKRETLRNLASLRIVFLGGEPISGARLKDWAESAHCRTELVNVYGTAECSDVSSFYRLRDYAKYAAGSVPIGTPIFRSLLRILDERLQPLPRGAIGEICISGAGLGRGYLNDAALTAERFLEKDFGDGPERIYRTGDLGCWAADGNLEYAGRVDHQAKIHGVRVELGEIETILRQHPLVREAVALVKEFRAGDQRIVAYVFPSQAASDWAWPRAEEEIRKHAGSKLPKNMVPNSFIKLKEVPLNPNGKIDRLALQAENDASSAAAPAPAECERSTTEVVIGAFISAALNLPHVGLSEDFFDLGGHSLMAIQVVTQINETFGTRFDLALFSNEKTTISGLAGLVSEQVQKRRSMGLHASAAQV